MKKLLFLVLICLTFSALAGEGKQCSPAWCGYEELKADSLAAIKANDINAINALNTQIEAAINDARSAGSGAVYALELRLANNLQFLDDRVNALPHYQAAYDTAPENARQKIGVALWNCTKSVADAIVRQCTGRCSGDDAITARKLYLWLGANRAKITPEWYEQVKAQIDFGIGMTAPFRS
jgi:hypothetical protein